MKLVPLTNGGFAKVDARDFLLVSKFNWFRVNDRRRIYAARATTSAKGRNTIQRMHRFLWPGIPQIDHRNGDGLDNQRANLRAATHRQNQQGFQRKRRGTTSRYRGVSWHSGGKKWKASILFDGKTHHIGLFAKERDAAEAFDVKARAHFGEFAYTNLP